MLLTGASGTVGYEVLLQLFEQKQKYNITIFDIKSKKSTRLFRPFRDEIEIIYGDISNFNDIKKACKNKDFVIHLAAIIPPLADDVPELAHKINYIGTKNIVENLEQLSPKTFFLYSSSISVYGDRLHNPDIKIGDEIVASERDEYAKTKIKAEKLIQNSKIDWAIFRLTAIMSGHKISKLMFHQPLETSLEIATSEDTARAFVKALDNQKKLSKKIFNLGGGKKCRILYRDFLIRSFSLFGLGKLNFPEKSFAEKNFHCGFYQDGDNLEEIIKFRKDTLDNYFQKEKAKISSLRKKTTFVFKNLIKKHLLKQSEPLKAFKNNDTKDINHFFEN